MKNYTFLCLALVVSLVAQGESPFFHKLKDNRRQVKKGYLFALPASTEQHDPWDLFHACAFTLPELLKKAAQEKLPVVLCVPRELEGLSPIDDQAPLIEGARVAITWASAFYRFAELGNVDTRILLVDENTMAATISSVMEISLNNEKPSEAAFEGRIFKPERLNKPHQFLKIEDFEITAPVQARTMLNTNLPECNHNQRRILITGGAGFVGSHLARRYIEDGHQVIVVDNLACCTGENINDLQSHPNFRFFNHNAARPFDTDCSLDSVLHLASYPSPVDYYNHPVETLESGLMGVKVTVELAKKKNARFFFSSTSEVYGDPEISPQSETYAGNVNYWGKRSQYDESKRGAETLLKFYHDRYNLDIRIARIFNTYGPGMRLHDGRVITNFIDSIIDNKPITVYGDGLQTRSFGYVDDTVDGLYRIETAELTSSALQDRIFNVGSPYEFTINELAVKIDKLCLRYFQRPATIIHKKNPDNTDPKQRRPSITKINTELGYLPRVELEEGLEKTLLFFMEQNK